ncbi:MAG: hypothetical protein ABW034_22435 [Steroidobacteraceae bacterium]
MEQSTRKLPATAAESPDAALVATGNGSALYVINLCASMAPIANSDKPLAGFEHYRVYQVSRKEDGRIRYRLRLGFFSDEAEAETALACIREQYPTAFATSLCDEDQRHTRIFASHPRPAAVNAAPTATPVAKPAAQRPQPEPMKPATAPPAAATPATPPQKPAVAIAKSAPIAAAKPASSASDTQRLPALKTDKPLQIEVEWEPAVTKDAPMVTADPTPAARKEPVAETPSIKPAPISKSVAPSSPPAAELTLASEPVAKQPPAAPHASANEPFHVGKGISIPASALSLEAEPVAPPKAAMPEPAASTPATQPSKATQSTPPKPATRPQTPAVKNQAPATPKPPAAKSAPPKGASTPALPKPPAVVNDDAPLPDFDSTQTIRALTAAELDDENQPKWFAVQLVVSDQPINLDTMPHLDIFSAYRLYSIATAGSGKILHHMRIGFFKEAVSAEAVCGYLKTFFANPTVLRVSVAEQTRFAEPPPKAAGAEPRAKVIDIAAARDRTPAREVPVVTMEVTPNPSASGRYPKPNTSASGVHRQPPVAKTAAKSAAAARTAPKKTKSTSASGKHKTLQEALLAEAREVQLSESAIRRLPKNSSLFSKLFGKK